MDEEKQETGATKPEKVVAGLNNWAAFDHISSI